jgi:hypothetical protein
MIKKTELIRAGRTKAQMIETIASAVDKKELPAMEPVAMCYMLAKQGYLSDRDGHWHPHLMFFGFTIRTRSLGSRPARLSNLRVQRQLGAPHHVPGSGARVVRRNG